MFSNSAAVDEWIHLVDRAIGSDIEKGEQVLSKGIKLGPSELGLLATVGGHPGQVLQTACGGGHLYW